MKRVVIDIIRINTQFKSKYPVIISGTNVGYAFEIYFQTGRI